MYDLFCFALDIRTSKSANPTPAERAALTELKNNGNITIKPADKGSAVVVMNTSDYIEEALRQLSDTKFYEKTTRNLTEQHTQEITKAVTEM